MVYEYFTVLKPLDVWLNSKKSLLWLGILFVSVVCPGMQFPNQRQEVDGPNSGKQGLENFWAGFICVCPLIAIFLLRGP